MSIAPTAFESPMATVSELVRDHLSRDVIARQAVLRDIANHQALARSLIQTFGWGATEAAVTSAIRRYRDGRDPEILQKPGSLFANGQLNLRANVCIAILTKRAEAQARLSQLFELIDYEKGELLRIMQSGRFIKVLIDESNLPKLLETIGKANVETIHHDLSEITIIFASECTYTPGVLAAIYDALAAHAINIVDKASGVTEDFIVVHEKDALSAYQALELLIERSALGEGDEG